MKLGAFSVFVLALLGAPALANETGKALFVENCSGCHQLGGVGEAGLAPPLVDKLLWSGLGDSSADYLAGVLIGGMSGTITAGGQKFIGLAMPPQDWMTDAELQAVADYVLNDLNGSGAPISGDIFAEVRKAPPSHADLRTLRKKAIP